MAAVGTAHRGGAEKPVEVAAVGDREVRESVERRGQNCESVERGDGRELWNSEQCAEQTRTGMSGLQWAARAARLTAVLCHLGEATCNVCFRLVLPQDGEENTALSGSRTTRLGLSCGPFERDKYRSHSLLLKDIYCFFFKPAFNFVQICNKICSVIVSKHS